MFFKRNLSDNLLSWKNSPERKPLLLMGMRQVGKTLLLKEFGKSAFANTAYFNFEEQEGLKQFFMNTKDVKRIIDNLALLHGSAITPADTLIIFDEIQECNQALNTLKYFCENAPEYTVACAGSLLGITLGREVSFPVGKVEFMDLHPLSFTEFLDGTDAALARYLRQIEIPEPIPDIFYDRLLEKFTSYFISGGMPEPAKTLVTGKNIDAVQKKLQDILNAYSLDFSKHAPSKDIAKIGYVWNSISAQLAKENKKFLYQVVKPGVRAREYEDALLWLIQSGLALRINRCTKPNLPLTAYDDLSAFKLYLPDVGLLRSHAKLDPILFGNGNQLFTEFKGALAENYVLQSLLPQFNVLPRYWTSEGKAEVDFLLQYQNQIIPVEVKAGDNIRGKSLAVYHQKYQPTVRIRFSLRNLSFDGGLLNIPLFLADCTKKLMGKILLKSIQ